MTVESYTVFDRDAHGANHLAPTGEEALHVADDCACQPEPHLRISDETGESRWTWLHRPLCT